METQTRLGRHYKFISAENIYVFFFKKKQNPVTLGL